MNPPTFYPVTQHNSLMNPPTRSHPKHPTLARRGLRLAAALTLLALLLGLAVPGTARAADASPPGKLTYQGFLTDANGVPYGNTAPQNLGVIFRIYGASTGGDTLVWSEKQQVTFDKGHFSVLLGEGSVITGEPNTNNLTAVFGGPSASDRFLELTLPVSNGTASPIAPRLQFLPAPYAVLARKANSLVGLDGAPIVTATTTGLNIAGTPSFSGSPAFNNGLNVKGANPGEGYLNLFPGSATTAGYISWYRPNGLRNGYIGSDIGGINNLGVGLENGAAFNIMNGNVGIGTPAPKELLHIAGVYQNGGTHGEQVSSKVRLSESIYGYGVTMRMRVPANATVNQADLQFTTPDNNASDAVRMTILGSGNPSGGYVGIGTTSPTEALTVAGNIALDGNIDMGTGYRKLMLNGGNTRGYLYGAFNGLGDGIHLGYNAYYVNGSGWSIPAAGGPTSRLSLGYGGVACFVGGVNHGPDTLAWYVNNSGNVGIKTDNPQDTLDVNGGIKASTIKASTIAVKGTASEGYVTLSQGDTTAAGYINWYRPSGIRSAYLGYNAAGLNNLGMWLENSASFSILNGNVGIGTSSPVAPLHVAGSTSRTLSDSPDYFNNDSGLTYPKSGSIELPITIKADNFVEAQGFVANSDRRIKQIVKPADTGDDLKTIQQLRVTDYRMVDRVQNGTGVRRGFIAQEVRAVIPGAVNAARGIVPSIYSLPAALKFDREQQTLRITMTNAHDLKAGDWVKLITEQNQLQLQVSAVPNATNFVVGMTNAPKQLFVYGKQVDDFLSVDYNRIFTSGIGAIQELSKQVETLKATAARIAELELKAARVDALEREMTELKRVVARLAEAQKGNRPVAAGPLPEAPAASNP